MSGKATSFLATGFDRGASDLSGNQRIGIAPLWGCSSSVLVLLIWVKPNGDFAK